MMKIQYHHLMIDFSKYSSREKFYINILKAMIKPLKDREIKLYS